MFLVDPEGLLQNFRDFTNQSIKQMGKYVSFVLSAECHHNLQDKNQNQCVHE